MAGDVDYVVYMGERPLDLSGYVGSITESSSASETLAELLGAREIKPDTGAPLDLLLMSEVPPGMTWRRTICCGCTRPLGPSSPAYGLRRVDGQLEPGVVCCESCERYDRPRPAGGSQWQGPMRAVEIRARWEADRPPGVSVHIGSRTGSRAADADYERPTVSYTRWDDPPVRLIQCPRHGEVMALPYALLVGAEYECPDCVRPADDPRDPPGAAGGVRDPFAARGWLNRTGC